MRVVGWWSIKGPRALGPVSFFLTEQPLSTSKTEAGGAKSLHSATSLGAPDQTIPPLSSSHNHQENQLQSRGSGPWPHTYSEAVNPPKKFWQAARTESTCSWFKWGPIGRLTNSPAVRLEKPLLDPIAKSLYASCDAGGIG